MPSTAPLVVIQLRLIIRFFSESRHVVLQVAKVLMNWEGITPK